jgi:hypothetical protein
LTTMVMTMWGTDGEVQLTLMVQPEFIRSSHAIREQRITRA